MPFLAWTMAVSASENPVLPKLTNPLLNCAEVVSMTVFHPHCESPLTGTVTVTWPLDENLEYSIDGVHYQSDLVFLDVLPGTYDMTYRNTVTGCTSAPNTFLVGPAVPVDTIVLAEGSAPSSQIVCINTAMETIAFTVGGTAQVATVSGLPPGVTGTFGAGVFTISGTPTSTGTYIYTITTSGGDCTRTMTGTLTVRLNAAMVWVSSSGARNQTLCQGAALNPIRFIIANGATGAVTNGLPSGLSGTFSGGIFTVDGMPQEYGTYPYTVTTTGGCSSATLSGTLVVNASSSVEITCNPEGPNHTLAFEWQPVSGATAYVYSYQIDGGTPVQGSVVANTHFAVQGVLPGQSVAFNIVSVNGAVSCFSPQSVTCQAQPLSDRDFESTSFKYYPNPVQHSLYLEHPQPLRHVAVFDLAGKMLIDKPSDANIVTLDLSGLGAGLYLVKATTVQGTRNFKIVKE
ncbi:Por secretion system C-terminal sorting domain-containing protein [Flavobacterium caeni]|uniref:Por secretion system C-terminal sorting domain-containing protein n=2 Tax=Flavobacterium caeni TaxID=490189 RepID=A0A1G5HXJ6_9FLAO|nr:Por secretion system C-terminal sorting domain-containing protein [Flavobacterium caeni]